MLKNFNLNESNFDLYTNRISRVTKVSITKHMKKTKLAFLGIFINCFLRNWSNSSIVDILLYILVQAKLKVKNLKFFQTKTKYHL